MPFMPGKMLSQYTSKKHLQQGPSFPLLHMYQCTMNMRETSNA